MKYGYCTGFSTNPHFLLGDNLLPMIKEAGFDFVEFPLMTFCNMTDSGFGNLVENVKRNGLAGPSACNFFPDSIKLVGKDVDFEKIKRYLDVVLRRCDALGIRKLILGSGAARTFGTDQTKEDASEQFVELLRNVILPETKKYSMTVCIETLSKNLCNLGISLAEGLELVNRVDDKNCSLMADLHHMMNNAEPIDSLNQCIDYIRHIHIAGANRRVPEQSDEYIYCALARLKELGYDDSVSFETELPSENVNLRKILESVKVALEGTSESSLQG
ncbi:MAG: sugar phosphate isomerase/epimerase [Sphaerochaetaceae bacterium]|nr:sugar phosphate isomerase/epimerase [Sphaerochaetaceae bacterium]